MNEKTSPSLSLSSEEVMRRREREEEKKFFSDIEQTNQINCLFPSHRIEDNSFIFAYHIRLYGRQTKTKQKASHLMYSYLRVDDDDDDKNTHAYKGNGRHQTRV